MRVLTSSTAGFRLRQPAQACEWGAVQRFWLNVATLMVTVAATAAPPSAWALDKQGSAHGGSVEGSSTGVNLSGALMAGVALYNPSYAARPDNTGLALMRYGAHVDLDLIGRYLSIPLDLNLFTDRTRPGLLIFAPTEFDVITGLTSTFELGPGALEVGARVEHDRPVDEGTFTQTYVDARGRYLFSAASLWPRLASALKDGDVSGWLTLGVFAFNPTYAARPDNTGLALFRYAAHVELSVLDDLVSIGLDGTFFSDRTSSVVLRPSELDFTSEVIVHLSDFELHVAYERDMPIDKPGLVQQFVYALLVWSFDVRTLQADAYSHRNQAPSP